MRAHQQWRTSLSFATPSSRTRKRPTCSFNSIHYSGALCPLGHRSRRQKMHEYTRCLFQCNFRVGHDLQSALKAKQTLQRQDEHSSQKQVLHERVHRRGGRSEKQPAQKPSNVDSAMLPRGGRTLGNCMILIAPETVHAQRATPPFPPAPHRPTVASNEGPRRLP